MNRTSSGMSISARPKSHSKKQNSSLPIVCILTWSCEEFDFPSPMKGVPAPKNTEAQVESFMKEEIEALLKACEYCREARTD